jgi:hypothetical protein
MEIIYRGFRTWKWIPDVIYCSQWFLKCVGIKIMSVLRQVVLKKNNFFCNLIVCLQFSEINLNILMILPNWLIIILDHLYAIKSDFDGAV